MSVGPSSSEDSANLFAELISSLDNVPRECQFLLKEIEHNDARRNELQDQIDIDSARYLKWVQSAGQPTPGMPGSHPYWQQSSGNMQNLKPRIDTMYLEVDRLSEENVKLAEKLCTLLVRCQNRIDVETGKIRGMQGETGYGASSYSPAPTPIRRQESLNPATQLSQSVMNAFNAGHGDSVTLTAPYNNMNKRRRTGGTSSNTPLRGSPGPQSIALSLPTLPLQNVQRAPSRTSTANARRAATQSRRKAPAREDEEDEDMDAEGDDDPDFAEEEEEDTNPYCFCHKPSFGHMIACDNPNCKYQWFHLDCIGLKPGEEPEKWFCPECVMKGFGRSGHPNSVSAPLQGVGGGFSMPNASGSSDASGRSRRANRRG